MNQRINLTLAMILSLVLAASPALTFASSTNPSKRIFSPKEGRLPVSGRTRRIPFKHVQKKTQPEGQTATSLPDGRLLLIGGAGPDGPLASMMISDPNTGETTSLPDMPQARAWHSATMLPDGRVLIVGGIGANGQVLERAGIFDPEKQAFQELPKAGITRAYHNATLLTDGKVLIVGGVSAKGVRSSRAELWSFKTQISRSAAGKLSALRAKAKATLLSDGNVLIQGGFDENEKQIGNSELFNSEAESFNFTTITSEQEGPETPFLTGSLPQDGATGVQLDSIIALRFSKPLRVDSAYSSTLYDRLRAASGRVGSG